LTERVSIEAAGVVVDEQRFPGRQGRLVFAYLLAAQGRPVPRDELADALWGDHPPARWEKALSVLVSKLRALLTECGIGGASSLTSAFGCYQLTLPDGTWIDVVAADEAARAAERSLAAGELDQARADASVAESLARRTFLPGEDGRWIEDKRADLRETLVRALDCLSEAHRLAGDPRAAVRAAEELVELEPYRERGYRLLMEAQSAAGNDAEALRVYERCRLLLAEELGAYPSPETEAMYLEVLRSSPKSGVVAVDARDAPPVVPQPDATGEPRRRGRRVPVAALIVVALLIVGATAVAVFATGSLIDARGTGESDGTRGAAATPRVAVVVPRRPSSEREDVFGTMFVDGLHQAERDYGVAAEIVVAPETRPRSRSFRRAIERVRSGDFDLVISPAGPIMQALGHVAVAQPSTRFVVLGSPVDLPNATGFVFDNHDTGYLVGYLSGLMEGRDGPRLNRARVLSAIGAYAEVDAGVAFVEGFREGARRALPGVKFLIDYSNDFVDRSKCEAIANRHIDAGADIVFAAAGACSFGAFAAAEIRGVWAISVDSDRSYLGSHILASIVTRFDRVLLGAVRSFVNGTLPGGRTLVLGLDDDAVGIAGISPSVPESIRQRVAQAAAALRRGDKP
jgi:basic membrane lipoprotein Med (substrate-binding protein (PBP1-ABC) superfamily)/DNA-binding SARP family transcriptional activator